MITFKCKMCGGDMELQEGATVAECPYCMTKQTLPKLDNDKRANMYDRANHFRRQNEYDKAMSIYEQILQEDRTDAEAYWSLVLCRYGIEYVEDPASKKRVPTVNRVQYTSILADEDYKSALEYADAEQRAVYETEAKAIDEIQKGILAISKQEEPFDVFICYKETDANGRRTPDSVLATDLYHQLTKEGFKAFFSRITLEDKIGTAYEPYIFAALNSAKVMVVLGTKPEYFNAVWVKNEWSRYLALIRAGADKTLVPAYRDMDPYDLPDEFSHLQAQDMSKLGFMQDLIRGIKKITEKERNTEKTQTVIQQNAGGGANIENLMKRVCLFLEDGDYPSANEYLDRILDENAEYAPAYIGKVLVKQKLHKEEDLSTTNPQYEQDPNWAKALRFATPEQKQRYEGYLDRSKQAYKEKNLSDQYNAALKVLMNATDEQDCDQAKRQFVQISAYKDSQTRIEQCEKKALRIAYDRVENKRVAIMRQDNTVSNAKELEKLIPEFEKLGDYSDSRIKAQLCHNTADMMRESLYNAAIKKLNNAQSVSEVESAEAIFRELGTGYKNVSRLLTECSIKKDLFKHLEILTATRNALDKEKTSITLAKQYESLAEEYQAWEGNSSGYKTCLEKADKIRAILYDEAWSVLQEAKKKYYDEKSATATKTKNDIEKAAKQFEELEDYKDAPLKVKECLNEIDSVGQEEERVITAAKKKRIKRTLAITISFVVVIAVLIVSIKVVIPRGRYREAEKLLEEKKYDEASAAFKALGSYSDAAARVNESYYVKGIKLYETGQFLSAHDAFVQASDYKDSAVRANRSMYSYGQDLYENHEYAKAIDTYENLGEFEDAPQRVKDISYEYGMHCYNEGDYASAIIPLSCCGKPEAEQLAEELRSKYKDRVVCSSNGIYAIKNDGTVFAQGNNKYGLYNVESWKDIVKIAPGTFHVVALKSDGTLEIIYDDYISWKDPQQVKNWKGVSDIGTMYEKTIALHTDGTCSVFNAGDISYDVNDWKDIVQIDKSRYNLVGLKADGTVLVTGSNERGQMNKVNEFSDIKQIVMGTWKIMGLRQDGTIQYSGWTAFNEDSVESWKGIKKLYRGSISYTVGLKNDGTVLATSGFQDHISSDQEQKETSLKNWSDIVDIVCDSNDFVAGLKRDGSVVLVKNGNNLNKEDYNTSVDDWNNIIFIYPANGSVVGLKSDGTLQYIGKNDSIEKSTVESWKLW